jgi:hypothetical protein
MSVPRSQAIGIVTLLALLLLYAWARYLMTPR